MKAKSSEKNLADLNADFLRACAKGNLKAVKKWIADGNPVIWRGLGNTTSLICAAENGHAEIVKILVEAGAELHETTTGRWSALALATTKGHADVVKVLLESGADPNVVTKQGDTPLSLAMKGGKKRIVGLLEAKNARLATSKPLDDLAYECAKQLALSVTKKGLFRDTKPKERAVAAKRAQQTLGELRRLIQNGAQGGDYALWHASSLGHTELLALLLKAKANPNSHPHLSSALSHAAEHGRLEAVCLLLDAGANPNFPFTWHRPILQATEKGHVEVVAELIRRGANVNVCARLGATPLLLATSEGHLGLMRVLLQGGADVNQKGTVKIGPRPKPTVEIDRVEDSKLFSRTTHYPDAPEALEVPPLVVAARRDLVEVLQVLIEFHPNLEATDKEGMTALAWSRKLGHERISELLVKAGANKSVDLDGSPLNALIVASEKGDLPRVAQLLADRADANGHLDSVEERKTPLAVAAKAGHVEVVKALLHAGAEVDKPVGERLGTVNRTPLMLAAEAKHVEVVGALLKAGASLIEKDGQVFGGGGETALHYAARGGSRDVVQLLLDAGAKASERTKYGDTPLKVASMQGHRGVIDLLLAAGGRVVARKGKASTLLHDAALSGNLASVRRLLKANPNAHGNDPELANTVAFGSKLDILKALIDAGLSVNGKDREGETPLFQASRAGRIQVVKFLLSQGADPKTKSKEGKTPLSLAREFGHQDLVRLFQQKIKT